MAKKTFVLTEHEFTRVWAIAAATAGNRGEPPVPRDIQEAVVWYLATRERMDVDGLPLINPKGEGSITRRQENGTETFEVTLPPDALKDRLQEVVSLLLRGAPDA